MPPATGRSPCRVAGVVGAAGRTFGAEGRHATLKEEHDFLRSPADPALETRDRCHSHELGAITVRQVGRSSPMPVTAVVVVGGSSAEWARSGLALQAATWERGEDQRHEDGRKGGHGAERTHRPIRNGGSIKGACEDGSRAHPPRGSTMAQVYTRKDDARSLIADRKVAILG